jgi:hydrocephalus-inducing protein
MDQLYDWCKKRGSPLAEEASKHLAARQDELAGKLAEQEKRRKAKKTAKDAVVPDVVEADFDHLPEDILAKMLRERLAQEDCNAGAIFDCLESDRWRGEQAAVAVICEALRGQNL